MESRWSGVHFWDTLLTDLTCWNYVYPSRTPWLTQLPSTALSEASQRTIVSLLTPTTPLNG